MDASGGDLPCVGKLEIAKPKPAVGFLCGTLPVLTDGAFQLPRSALVPSAQTIQAPRYQMLPTETDLNTLPILPNIPEKVIPITSRSEADENWESCPISQNLSRKCEALAVSGLAEYGDEIDVVAPADILKQIFKMPYSKARLSIAVNRIGDTLILNTGPDIEEGEKMFRKQSSNQPRSAESSIFLNFAMHSVRAEACDCPPGHLASTETQSRSTVLPGRYEHRDEAIVSEPGLQSQNTQFFSQSASEFHKKRTNPCPDFSRKNKDKNFWGSNKKNDVGRHNSMNKSSQIGEKLCGPVLESDKCRRVGNNGFLRVLFWQFHNFRMLLGSDLLLFSNDKYIAVSLHLWDITRKVTPLSWLEAWLDNVMASVPELAICYHRNGVVQGYELIKTDDIFLLKGLSEDGTPAFHPEVVQQNGLSVLRFLQQNCKQDPGAYWLYKSAGEDVIRLFDMSVLPKSNLADEHDISCSSLPSLMEKGRRDSLFSLGTLLYRVAHRLSLSKASDNKAKCAKFLKKCLNFVGEQDHLVVRAYAHEEFARLILRCYKELDITSESFLLESEVTVTDLDSESSEFSLGMFGLESHDRDHNLVTDDIPSTENEVCPRPSVEASRITGFETNSYPPKNISITEIIGEDDPVGIIPSVEEKERLAMLQFSTQSPQVQTIADPVSSKLAAIHHVCQAIKSLRWNRQLENAKGDLAENWSSRSSDRCLPPKFFQCTCGDPECIEVCDIREWLTNAKMDHKLWKLVLLLGESYLALGDAYREDGQLHQALRIVEIACSVYGSMPRHLEDAHFISSMFNPHPCQKKIERETKKSFYLGTENDIKSFSTDKYTVADQLSSSHLFWANAWTLVGDIFVDFHRTRNNAAVVQEDGQKSIKQLRMSNEVVKEVTRLKKKLGRFQQNCSTCSLINCSCQSDRVSSGNSASSSNGDVHSFALGRKHGRKSNMRNLPNSISEISLDSHILDNVKNPKCFGTGTLQKHDSIEGNTPSSLKHYDSSHEGVMKVQCVEAGERSGSESIGKDASIGKHGGIFKFLQGPKIGNVEQNLFASIDCYDAAIQAMNGYQSYITETQSIVKKKGWVFNELGRYRLENKDLAKAELAFGDAIKAFKAVSDHTNIILINYNLGYGRRAVAEKVVTEMENLRGNNLSQQAFKQSMKRAKVEYIESLKYYENAKAESDANIEAVDLSLRNELYTQYANTYLRLGMLLAREETLEEFGGGRHKEDYSVRPKHMNNEKFIGRKKCDISAGDAFREALSIYESLGEPRKQEAAFAHFQLACYHRASCLKFLSSESKQSKHVKCESNNRQKAKWYASLAERNWQKARDFYGPKTHPAMFLDILLELSALSHSLSNSLHSNTMLEAALSHLLEGRHVIEEDGENSYGNLNPEIQENFLQHLRALLKAILASSLSITLNNEGISSQQTTNITDDSGKVREMYRMSLKAKSLSQLYAMQQFWIS